MVATLCGARCHIGSRSLIYKCKIFFIPCIYGYPMRGRRNFVSIVYLLGENYRSAACVWLIKRNKAVCRAERRVGARFKSRSCVARRVAVRLDNVAPVGSTHERWHGSLRRQRRKEECSAEWEVTTDYLPFSSRDRARSLEGASFLRSSSDTLMGT